MSLFDQAFPDNATFATGKDGLSFAELLRGDGAAPPTTFAQAGIDLPGLITSAFRRSELRDMPFAQANARSESYDRLIAAIEKASGVRLENPDRGGFDAEATRVARQTVRDGGEIASSGGVPGERRRQFDQAVDALVKGKPELAEIVGAAKIDFSPEMLARRATMDFEARAADAPISAIGADLVAGVGASLRDPLYATTMFAGGGAGTAASALGRLGQTMLREGLINAGISALAQPGLQDWRRQIGEEAGLKPALEEIGMSFAIGGLFGGGVQGLRELRRFAGAIPDHIRADLEATARVFDGQGSKADIEAAARVAGVKLDDATRAEIDALSRAAADDHAARAPAGVDGDAHAVALAGAIRHAEDPAQPLSPAPLPMPAGVSEDAVRLALARRANPELAARLDRADTDLAAARARLDEFTRRDAPAPGLTERVAQLQRELDAFTGKRRSSPRAVELRAEIDRLTSEGEAMARADAVRMDAGERVMRERLNEAQQNRAGLGPEVNAAVEKVDLPREIATLRGDARLALGAAASPDADLAVLGRLALMDDRALAFALEGRVDAAHVAQVGALVADPEKQAAVLGLLARSPARSLEEVSDIVAGALGDSRIPESTRALLTTPDKIDPAPPAVREATSPAKTADGQPAAPEGPPRPPEARESPIPGNKAADLVPTMDGRLAAPAAIAEEIGRIGDLASLVAACRI